GPAPPRRARRAPESPYAAIALRRCCVDWHQVVVVEVDAPGAELRKTMYGGNWIARGPEHSTEGVAAAVPDRPEAEGEFVVARGRIGHMRQPSNQGCRVEESSPPTGRG